MKMKNGRASKPGKAFLPGVRIPARLKVRGNKKFLGKKKAISTEVWSRMIVARRDANRGGQEK